MRSNLRTQEERHCNKHFRQPESLIYLIDKEIATPYIRLPRLTASISQWRMP
ncbi:MAG: hypothetical protein IKZ88_01465 [Neisseriaceae bacterium]|nr:hypothetical protein [Neisseriaceae bacterium]